jgi:hypothetical protein
LAAFDLSTLEAQRLVAIAQAPGLRIGRAIHRSFRLSMLVSSMPHTFTLLRSQGLNEILHAYWRTQPLSTLYSEQEASQFGTYLLTQLKCRAIKNEFLEEIVHFELNILSLARSAQIQAPSPGTWKITEHETCYPYLNSLRRVVFFHPDPWILLNALGEDRIPRDVPQGDYYLVLDQSSEGQLEIKRVDCHLGRLLLACDGRRPVTQLCTELALTVQDFETVARAGFLHSLNTPGTSNL